MEKMEKPHNGFLRNGDNLMEVETKEEALQSLSTKVGSEATINRRRNYLIAIIISLLFITYLHYSTVPEIHALHDIYREFYYVPLFLAALVFGLRGAALTYALVLALYIPYIFISWTGNFTSEANKFLHLLLQGLLAFSAGVLIDRDRMSREQLQKERYLSGIGQAATAIVHDLKNPLVAILGFAKRVKEGKGNQDSNIQAIINSAHGMQRTVNDVLDFAKPIRLELREEDIRYVITRACDICKTKAEEDGVNISCNLPSAPVRILVDRFQMERAIANLLSNAIDASGKGQTITISTVISGNSLAIMLKDQGSGMDKETLENIFVPFYTKKDKGTGLGMSIAKKIVDGHGGRMYIHSKPGEGTMITIELAYKL